MPYFDKFDICQIHEESLMSEYMCECPLCRDIGIFGCLLKVGDLNKAGWFTLKSILIQHILMVSVKHVKMK